MKFANDMKEEGINAEKKHSKEMVSVVVRVKMVKFVSTMWKLKSRGSNSKNFLCKLQGLHLITS